MAVYDPLPHIPLPRVTGLLQDDPTWAPLALGWEHFANGVGFWLLPVAALILLGCLPDGTPKRSPIARGLLPLALILGWSCLLFPLGQLIWGQHLGSTPELVPNYRWPFAVSVALAIPIGLVHAVLSLKHPDRWMPRWLKRVFSLVTLAASALAALYVGLDVRGYSEQQALIALNQPWGCLGPPSHKDAWELIPEFVRWATGAVAVWILGAALFPVLAHSRRLSRFFSLRPLMAMGVYAIWAAGLTPLMFLLALGTASPAPLTDALSKALWVAIPLSAIHVRRLSREGRPLSRSGAWAGAAMAAMVFWGVLSEPLPADHKENLLVVVLDSLTRPELPPKMWRSSFE